MAVTPVPGRVRLPRQLLEGAEELRRLADEQPVGRQGLDRAHRSPPRLGRANDRTDRELASQEDGRLGHDQVGLEVLAAKRRRVEVGKLQTVRGVGQRRRIADEVVPDLEMHRLGRADAEQYPQYLLV